MSTERVFEVVKEVIMKVLPDVKPEQVSIDGNLQDLGANSIDRMEVVIMSIEELGLKVPLMSFARVSNIQDLVDVLTENFAASSESNMN